MTTFRSSPACEGARPPARVVLTVVGMGPGGRFVAEALARGAATRSREAIVIYCGCAVTPTFWSSHPELGGVAAPQADRQSTYCQVQPLP
jgi:hypothetical protein